MENQINKNFIELFFITSIEKIFYSERKIQFVQFPSKSLTLSQFNHKILFEEESIYNNKTYLTKLNCISFEYVKNININDNFLLFQVKDGSKFFSYECLIDRQSNNIQKKIFCIILK